MAVTIVDHLGRVADYSRRSTVPTGLRRMLGLAILCALAVWVMMLSMPLLGWVPAFQSPPATGTPQVPDSSNGVRLLMLVGSVCAAGTFGALVQSMRSIREGTAITSQKVAVDAVLGVAAGFLTAALYMLAQITITGKLDLPPTPADYSRVALIVSMAAVFASLYLDAAFSRFDLFKDSVMSGTYGKSPEGK